MGAINYRDLRRQVELNGVDATCRHLTEALQDKSSGLEPEDFSIKKLYEHTVCNAQGDIVGRDVLEECFDPTGPRKSVALAESTGSVNTGAFTNIMGQIAYTKFLEGARSEAFRVSAEIPVITTRFDGEKIPGVAKMGRDTQIVEEGKAYPLGNVAEDYIETPSTKKRGLTVNVTKEAVFFDRTGMVLREASMVGEAVGEDKENRAIDCLIDQNTTAHRYKWRGTVYATYQTSTPWINKKTSNGLVDWQSFNNAEQLLAAITDPNNGSPIAVMADTVIVAPEKYASALMALSAMGATINQGGYATSGTLYATATINPTGSGPYSGTYKILSSRFIPGRLATDTDWFLGAPKKAFAYMENWPITVVQAPSNSEMEFTNDVVYRFKASERGAYATLEPRCMVWNVA